MDTSKVTRGLSKISRGFGAFSKQVGIGATRRVGEKMTDLAGRLAMAIPGTIRDTAEFVSNLDNLERKTGMSAQQLVILGEKMRLAGVETSDVSDSISNLAEKLYEAQTEGGTVKKALNDLGFSAYDFKNKRLDESFEMIGKSVATLSDDQLPKMTWALAQIFGGDVGMEMVKLFRNYDEATRKATLNTMGLNQQLGEDGIIGRVDEMADAMGRFQMFRMRVGLGLISTMEKVFGRGYMDKFFDFLNNDVVPVVLFIAKKFGDFIQSIRESGDPLKAISDSLGNIAKSIGKSIGDGFRESLGEIANPKNILKGFLGGKTASRQESLAETNRLLASILEKTPGEAVFS